MLTAPFVTFRGNAAVVTFAILLLTAGIAAAEVPPRTAVGQTLAVPDGDFERGQIFYILPGQDTQVVLISTARLQRTILTTSRAVGYIVATFDPEDSARPIISGALRLPAAALSSDSPAIDAQLLSDSYLDVAAHPEIIFELTGTGAAQKLTDDDKDVFPYRLKLSGKLTARGVSREIEMTAEVRFLLTNFSTFPRAVGDLLTVAGSFEIEPADFGWEMPPAAAGLIASSLEVDVFLLGSTRSPENNLDPNLNVERWLAEQRYLTLARDFADSEAAASAGGELLTRYRDDAGALHSLARLILEEPGLRNRDLALVSRLVKRARELDTEGEQTAEIISLLAAARGEVQ